MLGAESLTTIVNILVGTLRRGPRRTLRGSPNKRAGLKVNKLKPVIPPEVRRLAKPS